MKAVAASFTTTAIYSSPLELTAELLGAIIQVGDKHTEPDDWEKCSDWSLDAVILVSASAKCSIISISVASWQVMQRNKCSRTNVQTPSPPSSLFRESFLSLSSTPTAPPHMSHNAAGLPSVTCICSHIVSDPTLPSLPSLSLTFVFVVVVVDSGDRGPGRSRLGRGRVVVMSLSWSWSWSWSSSCLPRRSPDHQQQQQQQQYPPPPPPPHHDRGHPQSCLSPRCCLQKS